MKRSLKQSRALFCSHSVLFIFSLCSCCLVQIKKHPAAAAASPAAAASSLKQLIGQKVMRHRYAAVPETDYSGRLEGSRIRGSGPSTK